MELKEIVQKYTPAGTAQTPVDAITRGAPLFETAVWGSSNSGMTHVYEELVSILEAQAVDLNGAYGAIGAEFNLKNKDLAFYGGRKEVPTNTVDMTAGGDVAAYLAKQMPPVFNKTLMSIEYQMFYNILRPFAKANSQISQISTSSTGDVYNTLFFVRWEEDQMMGLVNDAWARDQGGIFTVKPLSSGDRYVQAGTGVSVYGVDVELPLGLLPANKLNISVLANIDLATVTDADLAKAVTKAMVKSGTGLGGRTVAYGHPLLIARIGALQEAKTAGIDGTSGLYLAEMAGIPFVGDWNLLEQEAFYTI